MKIAAGVLDRGGRVPRVFVLMFFCFAFLVSPATVIEMPRKCAPGLL
jgi:hypothetical protein